MTYSNSLRQFQFHIILPAFFSIIVAAFTSCQHDSDSRATMRAASYPSITIIWPNTTIPVCFEPISDYFYLHGYDEPTLNQEILKFNQAKAIVKTALEREINQKTLIRFIGFEHCTFPTPLPIGTNFIRLTDPGIRILLTTDTPQTNAIGQFLNGLMFGLAV